LLPLIGPANAAIARYAVCWRGFEPNVLLSPMTVAGGCALSKIEGTQATMGEVLELEAKAAWRRKHAEERRHPRGAEIIARR